MNILLYDFLNSYIQYDLLYYLKKMGHKCNNILYRKQLDKYEDTAFMDLMEKEVSGGRYDLVLTTNFGRWFRRFATSTTFLMCPGFLMVHKTCPQLNVWSIPATGFIFYQGRLCKQ